MDIFTILQFLLLSLLCWYLVNYYAAEGVSLHIKFWSTLTWIMNFGLVLLVPADIYFILNNSDSLTQVNWSKYVVDNTFIELANDYLILYWTVYLLTWTIIPILQQWQNSGDLQSMDRLKRSFRTNGWFYLYMIIGAIISLIILILINAAGNMGLITYLQCLASAFGIFLLMILMGYAMVQIPKSHWRTGDIIQQVKYLHFRISQAQQQIVASIIQLQQVISHIYKLRDQKGKQQLISKYIEKCLSIIPEKIKIKMSKRYKQDIQQLKYDNYQNNLQSAIELHRLTKRALARVKRAQQDLQSYIKRALLAEDIRDSLDNPQKKFVSKIKNPKFYDWYWYCKIKPILKRVFALFLGLGSLLLLIAETQVFLSTQKSILSYLLQIKNITVIRFLSLLFLSYVSYMVYYSLFRLKLSNLYGLYKKGSDGPSLMFATINFSRVAAPLVVNFFDMVKIQGIFTYIMGGSKLGLLGDWIIKGMPGVLWIMVLMHYFDGWSKLMNLLGLKDWGFSKWNGQDSVVSILKERRKKLQNL